MIPSFPSYFSKDVRKDVTELYRASAVSNFALALVGLFEPIFLYNVLHYTVPQVLLFTAIVYAVYIVGIPFGGKIASSYGYRHSIALSVPFQIFYWLALLASVQHPAGAYLAAAMYGVQKSFYWPGFHSVIARYAQSGQVGREFSAAYAINSLAQIGGPLLGGIVAQYAGIPTAFFIAAVIYCFSIIPLLNAKEVFTPKNYSFSQTLEMYRNYPKKFFAYLGFGEELLVLTIWPIFIFTVVKDYKDTGLLAAAASLLAALFALFLGQMADKHTKHVLVKIGTLFNSLFWVGRFFVGNFITAFAFDTASKTAKETLFIPLSTITYLRAEETHVVPYTVFFEQSLAIGKLSASLIGMLLFSLTGSFMVLFILGALFSLLYMYI
jgi:MFS family permease